MTKSKHTLDAEIHPAADMFPLLDDEELAILAEDIKRHGLYLPIVLDTEGRILDGRNRARACAIAGVEPRTVVYDGDRPELYVLSANAYRRHMTTGAQGDGHGTGVEGSREASRRPLGPRISPRYSRYRE